MNEIIPFDYESTQVRVIERQEEPWFVLADLCKVLGIANPRNVSARLDDELKNTVRLTDGIQRGNPNVTIVNESGMYEVILRSDAPNAKPFRRWVTSEVLPTIRKTGAYGAPQLTGPELVATALIEAQSMLEAKDRQITELAPKAESFDGYLSTVGDYSINEAAKLLRRRGVQNMGQNRLRDHLLMWRWLYRGRKDRLRASQVQIDNGRMAELTSYYYDKVTGEQKAGNTRPRVTAKGLDAIQKRLTRDLLPIEDGVA